LQRRRCRARCASAPRSRTTIGGLRVDEQPRARGRRLRSTASIAAGADRGGIATRRLRERPRGRARAGAGGGAEDRG
jgi:hypothetical protein